MKRIKKTMTSVMQTQTKTKECKILQAQILPKRIIELSMESNKKYKSAPNNPKWLEFIMPKAKMKREKWFSIKCNNVLKSHVIKKGSNWTAI